MAAHWTLQFNQARFLSTKVFVRQKAHYALKSKEVKVKEAYLHVTMAKIRGDVTLIISLRQSFTK